MAPFRRPGLEDDGDESRPEMLLRRPPPSFRSTPVHSSVQQRAERQSFAGDDDSVVSGLSAMSDLESLYLESSSRNRPKDARDQYLLAQRLPGQTSSPKDDQSRSAHLLNGLIDEIDEEDNWEDMVYAATIQQSHQPRMASKPQHSFDPVEQELLDLNRAIAESRLHHEKEQIRLAQIVEDDEEPPKTEKKYNRKSLKKKAKKEKKNSTAEKSTSQNNFQDDDSPRKKGGIWSNLTSKKYQK